MTANGSRYKKKVQDALKDRERKLLLKHKYETRITIVKQGKAAFLAGDFVTAIRRYTEYLETQAVVLKIGGIYDLRPEHFHKTKDITELLMISHLYYELAKVYDATGKFQGDVQKCLEQFVLFTANQPYQVVNSEMARKHLSKFQFRDHQAFFKAHQQIFINSRKCYIATHCFSDTHPITERLRLFKGWLLQQRGGYFVVRSYYRLSPLLVGWLDRHPRANLALCWLLRPLLAWFSSGPLKRIIKL